MSGRAFLFALFAAVLSATAFAQQFDPFQKATIEEKLGAMVPLDVPLVDAKGEATTLRQIAGGKPLLLVPVLHECPNLCGVTLVGVTDAIAEQKARPGRDFGLVAFGIDPREGPAQSRDDLQRLHAARASAPVQSIAAVTGSAQSIGSVTQAMGYRYAWDPRIGQYAHVAATAVIAPDGRLSSWLYGAQPSADQLSRALEYARADKSGSVMQRLILLCYHFDPATGRYSLLIDRVIKIAAIATVLVLAALLFFLGRQRRTA